MLYFPVSLYNSNGNSIVVWLLLPPPPLCVILYSYILDSYSWVFYTNIIGTKYININSHAFYKIHLNYVSESERIVLFSFHFSSLRYENKQKPITMQMPSINFYSKWFLMVKIDRKNIKRCRLNATCVVRVWMLFFFALTGCVGVK